MIINLLSAAFGLLLGILLQPLTVLWGRKVLGPHLELSFGERDYGCVVKTEQREDITVKLSVASVERRPPKAFTLARSGEDVCFVRIKVINTKSRIAKNCRAYLVGIDMLHPSDLFTGTKFCDSLQLCWSYSDPNDTHSIDLPMGVAHYVDLLKTVKDSTRFFPAVNSMPAFYEKWFESNGTYRFKVTVVGDDATPQTIGVSFTWRQLWDEFDAAHNENRAL